MTRAAATVVSVNCDPTTTFGSLWKRVAGEISINLSSNAGIGFKPQSQQNVVQLSTFLKTNPAPDDIRILFSRLGRVIIIIDELDRIRDKHTTTLLADTIKALSDHAVDTTLLLVGVADSVDVLIAEHQSVERALVQIRMPRMSPAELGEIIDKGLKQASMSIEGSARDKIIILSQGLPHYTHLLAQNAAQRSAIVGEDNVNDHDVRVAIDSAVSKAQQSTRSAYHTATSSSRENMYPQVLLACALATSDELGYFSSSDVRNPLSEIMGKQYDIPAYAQHLNALCSPERGPVLQKTGRKRSYKFRFINPLLQPYVLMDGIRRGLTTESSIRVNVR